ncbi:MAG: DUF2512 family protein [Bacteroidota bacterium]
MARWESFAVKLAFMLLILASLGPLLGQAGLAQTMLLGILLAGILYFLGDAFLLPKMRAVLDNRVAAAGDGLAAAVILRYLAPMLGARFGWGASLILGAAIGVSEYYQHRWEGARAGGRMGGGRQSG